MQLEDRYYTSTEVAEILGVSLRSVYRYMEDGKLQAEIKTATGRHRFTRNDILDFLYPDRKKGLLFDEDEEKKVEKKEKKQPAQKEEEPQEQEEVTSKEEQDDQEVDWLAKFREAAAKYKEEQQTPQPQTTQVPQTQQPQPQQQQPAPAQPAQQTVVPETPQPQPQTIQAQPTQTTGPTLMYYRSMLGGLKDIAQTLDKSARNSNLDYAFTLNAGASLHKPIKPFATLHAYVRPTEKDFFEKLLRLSPSNQANAQLCLILSGDSSIYNKREEVHGLYVVSKDQLKKDINTFGDAQLAQEVGDVL